MKVWCERVVAWFQSRPGQTLFESLSIAGILGLCLIFWPQAPVPPGLALPQAPWWGGIGDMVLEGPDAAQWAENAQRMADGAFDQLDSHRMPSWLLVVAGLIRSGFTVVEAGHFVNRAMFIFAALGTYGLGRAIGGRATGIIAAVMVLGHTHLMLGTQRFGIDAAIEAMLPVAMTASFLVAIRWWLGLPVGLLVGWVIFLHHTTIPFVIPSLLLTLLMGQPGWKRWAGATALLVGVLAVVAGLSQFHPLPGLVEVERVVMEGARPGSTGVDGILAPASDLLADVQAKIVAALPLTASKLGFELSNRQIAGEYSLWLLALGVVSPLMSVRSGNVARRLAFNTAIGVVLLSCLAPLPVLSSIGAPPRYGNNLTGIAMVLVARGLVSTYVLGELALRYLVRLWPLGVIPGAVATGFLYNAAKSPPPVPPLAETVVGFYQLGESLRSTFPMGAKVACPPAEALMQAGLRACLAGNCPVEANEPAIITCMQRIARSCPIDGDIGYVALPGRQMYDPNSPGRPAMDAWIAARFQPVDSVQYSGFSAYIYRIPIMEIPVVQPASPPALAPDIAP